MRLTCLSISINISIGIGIGTILLSNIAGIEAWTTVEVKSSSRRITALKSASPDFEEPSFTRRQWFGQATATAAAAATATASAGSWMKPSYAAETANVVAEKPAVVSPKIISNANTCDAAVSVWKQPGTGRQVYLLGTAHISSSSAQLAGMLVDDVRPEAVFVELDTKRLKKAGVTKPLDTEKSNNNSKEGIVTTTTATTQQLPSPSPSSNKLESPAAATVISAPEVDNKPSTKNSGGLGTSLAGAAVGKAISGLYVNLNKAGFRPGDEFTVAMNEAEKIGATIILGDRDVEVTLQRLAEALRKTLLKSDLTELEQSLSESAPANTIVDINDPNFKDQMSFYVETMKNKENVKLSMEQLRKVAPEIYQAMVGERDAYMANGLDKLGVFPTIVAVMGMAHIDGVETILQQRGWEPVPLLCKA